MGYIPEGDILIHAGDCTMDIGKRSLREFLQWFQAQGHPIKMFIAGNHDGAFQKWPELARQMVKDEAPDVHYLEESGMEAMGKKFWGSPWTPTFYDWHFMADRGEAIAQHWAKIPKDTDVLITHGPPFGYLDKSNNWDSANGKRFEDCLGDRDLYQYAYGNGAYLDLHVWGHIHGSGGRQVKHWNDDGWPTLMVNASIMDEAYMPTHKPVVIDL